MMHDRCMPMVAVELGRQRTPSDGCRRYRPLSVTFDTRPVVLAQTIEDHWEPRVKEQWRTNQRFIREGLLHEFGVEDGDRKIADFLAVGPAPWSVSAMHNLVLAEVRRAFVGGAYYPALLGAAGLGERILNQLMLELRDDFSEHAATARVAGKGSVDNWTVLIQVLGA